MKPIYLKKISDKNNVLGHENIKIIDRELSHIIHCEKNGDGYPQQTYKYRYLCIADGSLTWVKDFELVATWNKYKVVRCVDEN